MCVVVVWVWGEGAGRVISLLQLVSIFAAR